MASDSPRAITPRTIGSRKKTWRAIAESIERETGAISPDGVRTATAQLPGPRIITPSRTACPPTVDAIALPGAGRALCALGALEPLLEAFETAARVDELLLARVERVAVRADLDVQLGLRRPRLEGVSARARHGCEDVLGMDVSLHDPRIAAACFGAMLPPETTATTFCPGSTPAFPASSAATPATPPSSAASFVRP